MNLKIQVFSLLFSFFFGVIFSVLVNINYKLLFTKYKIFQVIVTLLFVIFGALIYFFLLKFINNGVIHPYFYLMVFIGFYFSFSKAKFFRKK